MKGFNYATDAFEREMSMPALVQKIDLVVMKRQAELRDKLYQHVVALRETANQIDEARVMLQPTSDELLRGAMPDWYEQAASIVKDDLARSIDLLTSVADRLTKDYLG